MSNQTITPFESAKISLYQFSHGLHNDYVLQQIIPMIDRISKLYDESITNGDEESAMYYKNTQEILLSTIPSIDVGA